MRRRPVIKAVGKMIRAKRRFGRDDVRIKRRRLEYGPGDNRAEPDGDFIQPLLLVFA